MYPWGVVKVVTFKKSASNISENIKEKLTENRLNDLIRMRAFKRAIARIFWTSLGEDG